MSFSMDSISFTFCWVLVESFLISSATTAKLSPCSPACAAIMAAFRERRLVWSATSLMMSRTLETSAERALRDSMILEYSSTICMFFFHSSFISETTPMPDVFALFDTSSVRLLDREDLSPSSEAEWFSTSVFFRVSAAVLLSPSIREAMLFMFWLFS